MTFAQRLNGVKQVLTGYRRVANMPCGWWSGVGVITVRIRFPGARQ